MHTWEDNTDWSEDEESHHDVHSGGVVFIISRILDSLACTFFPAYKLAVGFLSNLYFNQLDRL